MFSDLKRAGFDVLTLYHAEAILTHDLPGLASEMETALLGFSIPAHELIEGGGGEGQGTQRLRRELEARGWKKHTFEITKTVDGVTRESASHIVDHVRRHASFTIALEIEWNNKDPFFDRDLDNFKRLHADGAISLGVIITRGDSLQHSLVDLVCDFAKKNALTSVERLVRFYHPTPRQQAIYNRAAQSADSFEAGWAKAFVADKFGQATTHWAKLEERVKRGVGNPCPLLLIGIPSKVVIV